MIQKCEVYYDYIIITKNKSINPFLNGTDGQTDNPKTLCNGGITKTHKEWYLPVLRIVASSLSKASNDEMVTSQFFSIFSVIEEEHF